MTKNVGTIDRVVRALVGVVIGSSGILVVNSGASWGYGLTGLGGLLLLSSVCGFCALYRLIGHTTCRS